MSALTKFLSTEVHRKKMKEKKAGLKTPLTMRMNPHQDLDSFFVSTSRGKVQCVGNAKVGVPTNFFELEPQDEDAFHAELVDQIFIEGCENKWGGVAMMDSFTRNEIDDIKEYFLTYDLSMFQIMCGPRGYKALQETGILVHPSGKGGVSELPDLNTLKEWEKEHFVVGMLDTRPVFLNEFLGPYIVFSAHPSFVGILTRIDTNITIFLHNAERGVVVVRLPEPEHETEEEVGEEVEEEDNNTESANE